MSITSISIDEIKTNYSNILEQLALGKQFIFLQEGKEIARIIPSNTNENLFPSLKNFRETITVKGILFSEEIINEREGNILIYLDTSAVVPYYIPENLSDKVEKLLQEQK